MAKDYFVFQPDTNILKALEMGEPVVEAFKRLGLKCATCVAAEVEDLRLAALYHAKDLQTILHELNELRIVPPPPKKE